MDMPLAMATRRPMPTRLQTGGVSKDQGKVKPNIELDDDDDIYKWGKRKSNSCSCVGLFSSFFYNGAQKVGLWIPMSTLIVL